MPGVTMDAHGSGRGLRLSPLRGLRYVPERISGLAQVTSPPYDVLDTDSVLALESSDPHNVVRLILPREEESGPEGRYEHAARALHAWMAEGILRPDVAAGLYLYEQSRGSAVLQRGLIGALALRDPGERVVLPHEDVMAGPVTDRLALMRAARANVEPILLMYDGKDGAAAEVIARTAALPPLITATGPDQLTHSLWQMSDPVDLEAVSADLHDRQALIADGHHRYAAYRRLQSELRDLDGPGPWDEGLALLVDLRAYPPQVGAIHRSVDGLELADALVAADPLFDRVDVAAEAVDDRLSSLSSGEMLLVDANGAATLTARDPDGLARIVTERNPSAWGRLDTAVLHTVLLERTWHVQDAAIGYHHEPGQALAYARKHGALAVLLAPVDVQRVLDIAAQGVRMPRKSTSFGPKPRTGFVLRSFDLI